MHIFRQLVQLLLFVILLSACSLPLTGGVPRVHGATPEDVAHRHVPNLARPAPAHVQIHGTRETPHGVVVLYTAAMPQQDGPPNPPNMGYVLTKEQGGTWQVTESTYGASHAAPGQLVAYRTGPFGGSARNAWIVYGRVFDPNVAAVEVAFDTGQVLRDRVTGDMFSLSATNATTACEVRALDAQGVVLQQSNPAAPHLGDPNAHERATRCPGP